MIWADEWAARAPVISSRLRRVVNHARAGRELIDRIHGDGHAHEDQCADDNLRPFLVIKIIEDQEKKRGVNENAIHLHARDVFDISGAVTPRHIADEREHGPREWWPEDAIFAAHPEANRPEEKRNR